MKEALDHFTASGGGQWELNEGDGAFYGPKIDVTISDALKRDIQCATIQLDFQLPQRFELEYMTAEAASKPKDDKLSVGATSESATPAKPKQPGPGRARPVMLHRAIVGSFERFIAILTEHFAGRWPFWLSPRQVLIVPVMPAVNDYVLEVQSLLRAQKMNADVDISGNTMPKKIKMGQLQLYNFIFGMWWHLMSLSQLLTDLMQFSVRRKKSRDPSTFETGMIKPRKPKGNLSHWMKL